MSFKKARNIFFEIMQKNLLIEDGELFISDFLPVRSLSYQHSKNVWVMYNHLGRIGIVNIKKRTVRPDFLQPPYKKYIISCRLKRIPYSNSQGILVTPQQKQLEHDFLSSKQNIDLG